MNDIYKIQRRIEATDVYGKKSRKRRTTRRRVNDDDEDADDDDDDDDDDEGDEELDVKRCIMAFVVGNMTVPVALKKLLSNFSTCLSFRIFLFSLFFRRCALLSMATAICANRSSCITCIASRQSPLQLRQ